MGDLTKNFNEKEYYCTCNDPECQRKRHPAPRLYESLQKLRDIVGRPIYITSGWRCPKGPKDESYHTVGHAVDCRFGIWQRPEDLLWLYSSALKVSEFKGGGIGIYPPERSYDGPRVNGPYGFIHLDVRPYEARWSRMNGKYTEIETGLDWLDKNRFSKS